MENFVLGFPRPNIIFMKGAGGGGSVIVSTSAAPAPSTVGPAPSVRKYFPETWIWDCKTVRFVVKLM